MQETNQSITQKLDFLKKKSIGYEDFKSYLIQINGGITGHTNEEDILTQGSKEVGHSEVVQYLPPDVRDHDMLLREVLNACKSIRNKKDRALLIYLEIQMIHPFSDGNGRTGRLIYNLLVNGTPATQDRKIFAQEHVKKIGRVLEIVNRELFYDLFPQEFTDSYHMISLFLNSDFVDIGDHINPESLRLTASKIVSENFPTFIVDPINSRELVILKFLHSERDLSLDKSPFYPDNPNREDRVHYGEHKGKKIFGINGSEFIKSLTKEDCQKLILIHREMKIALIRKLIDIITKPKKYKKDRKPLKNSFFPIKK